jgi:hypothetical protein
MTIDATVAALPGHNHLLESRFAKESLTETFEASRWECLQYL